MDSVLTKSARIVSRGDIFIFLSHLNLHYRGVVQCEVLVNEEIHGMKEVRVRNYAAQIAVYRLWFGMIMCSFIQIVS